MGVLTNHDEWKNNAIDFLDKHKNSENRDFILGYCAHLLTDVYNSENVWTPFRLKYPHEIEAGRGNLHHIENNKIDIELALTYEGRGEFWGHLANSESIDFLNLIYAAELDIQKDYILNSWYKGKERQDVSANKIRTYEGEMDFIKKASDFVFEIFRDKIPK